MYYRLLSLSIMLFSLQVIAENIKVYRWVDDNNIVHFSQHQPAHDNFTEITMNEVNKSSEKKNVQQTVPLQANNTTNAFTPGLVEKKSNERCETAKANLRTLTAFDRIQYTDDNGATVILSNEEKIQQKELSQKQVEIYCQNK